MSICRRTLLQGLGLAGLSTLMSPTHAAGEKPKWPKKPDIPTDFNPEEFFEELKAKGTGIHFPGKPGRLSLYMVFDPQCPWCVWEYNQLLPFKDQIDVVWFPVAVLNPWSEQQGAAMLTAPEPYKAFLSHEANFKSADFKGLDPRRLVIPFEKREAVWINSKIYRRAGGRSVPFGVLKTADGRYVPVAEQNSEAFAKLLK